ncbi:MAG: hypothetical protein WA632_08140 [Gallionella sp.]
MTINNDSEFKLALSELSRAGQRLVGARFAENVLTLCSDARVKHVIATAMRSDLTDEELDAAIGAARKASVDSFTQCGAECDWHSQAGHFVAEAALASVKQSANSAWDAAMHARMARTSESIATGIGTDNAEAEVQYRILAEFMKD